MGKILDKARGSAQEKRQKTSLENNRIIETNRSLQEEFHEKVYN